MPLYWEEKIVLAKTEASYGTDAVPTGAANGVLLKDLRIMPMEGADVERDLDRAYFGNDGTLPAELHSKISFKVELAPSGAAGTAPAWGPILRGCGVAETIVASTSVTYNPITRDPEALTIYFWVGDTLHKLKGSRGNAKFALRAQGVPEIEFEFNALWSTPAEAARDLPVLTAYKKPLIANNANTSFTLGGVVMVLRQATLDLANQLENRFLIGSESVEVTGKAERFEATVEAVALTTLHPYALAESQSTLAVMLQHGTQTGARATLDIPAAQMQRPSGLEANQGIAEWNLSMAPLPVSGNDQWTLTLN